MRILLTNDDGVHAPGLALLEKIAREISDDVYVVAPERDQSGVAHSLSLSDPLRVRAIGPRHFAVKGTPTDCVIIGVRKLMEAPPDLVLSGVNTGQNVADDVTYSGTIAAAMEGTILGIPSIALSQAFDFFTHPPKIDWACAAAHAGAVIRRLVSAGIPPNVLMNVNFPACAPEGVTGIAATVQGRRSSDVMHIQDRVDGRGYPYHWIAFRRSEFSLGAGTDLEALDQRKISVTPLKLDFTDHPTVTELAAMLERAP